MRRRDLLLWPLAVAAAAGGALLILHVNPVGLLVGCPLRIWTGIPCPTCGGTLAVRELLAGHLLGALAANPLVTLVILTIMASGIAALVALPWAGRIRTPWRPSGRLILILVIGLLALNWLYLFFHL
jgi:hypothetical protein